MNTPTQTRIDTLPKWAQEYISSLKRQKETAVKVLNKAIDDQTPSKIWTERMECLNDGPPNFVKRYFQAENIEIEHKGVKLCITGLYDDKEDIKLAWGPAGSNSRLGDICFVPTAYQQARLTNLVYHTPSYEELQRVKARDETL